MAETTKQKLVEMFYRLADRKNIDKITVKDLVEAAGVTRQAFYYHFRDIPDLIEWSLKEYAETIVRDNYPQISHEDSVHSFVRSIKAHGHMVRQILASNHRTEMEDMLLSAIRHYIQNLVDRLLLYPEVKRSDWDTVITFYSYATMGILIEYSRKKDFDEEILTKQLVKLYAGNITPQYQA